MCPHLTVMSWNLLKTVVLINGGTEAETLSGQRPRPYCHPPQPEELVPLDFRDISLGQTRNCSFDAGKMVGLALRKKAHILLRMLQS